jgi:hypothetical protein
MGSGWQSVLGGLGTGAGLGASFGAPGAIIGGAGGALLGGLASVFSDSERRRQEEELRKKAREQAKVELLRNYASAMGAPTADLDMKLKLDGIDQQLAAQDQSGGVQSFVPFVTGAATAANKLYRQGQADTTAMGAQKSAIAGLPDAPDYAGRFQLPQLGSSAGLDDDYTKKLRLNWGY